ncbi:hypothetical protein P4631_09085 [Halalkalibacterium halodurans]|uniref:hypothetical protein n=1 Tax=Halalkalibacterium halodurans TaxID=86665 RepID=UPI002E1B9C68|nr:hypothetical protein [Halalkalibacterium halodurans]
MTLDFIRLQKSNVSTAVNLGYKLEEIYDMTDDPAVKAALAELAKDIYEDITALYDEIEGEIEDVYNAMDR